MVVFNPTFAMGIDPGLTGGALCFISPDYSVFELHDLKAKSLEQSAEVIQKACLSLWAKYCDLRATSEQRLVGVVETAEGSYGVAHQGKTKQLINVGIAYGVSTTVFGQSFAQGADIQLARAKDWKQHFSLTCHRKEGETESDYTKRKKHASKTLAVSKLWCAGAKDASLALENKRHDFSEAYLLALYALRSDFTEND